MSVIDRLGNWTPTREQEEAIDVVLEALPVVWQCFVIAAGIVLLIQPAAYFWALLVH